MDRRAAVLLLVACNLLWAGTYVAGKTALATLSPVELNALRFGGATLLFLPFLLRARLSFSRGMVARLIRLCLFGFVLNKAAEFSGLALTTASDTALLIAAEGIFTALFGRLLLGEALRRTTMLGMALSVIGVYLVIERGIGRPSLGGGTRVIGDLLVIGALAFEAIYSVLGKAEAEESPAVVVSGACVAGSLVVWLPAAGVNVSVSGPPVMSAGVWAGVLYLAIGGTFLAYLGWIIALQYVEATVAAPTLFLQPLVGTLLAVLLLHDRIVPVTLLGGALIVAGIWVVSRVPEGAEGVVGATDVLA